MKNSSTLSSKSNDKFRLSQWSRLMMFWLSSEVDITGVQIHMYQNTTLISNCKDIFESLKSRRTLRFLILDGPNMLYNDWKQTDIKLVLLMYWWSGLKKKCYQTRQVWFNFLIYYYISWYIYQVIFYLILNMEKKISIMRYVVLFQKNY